MSSPNTPFVHLHLHTQYSLLDGANKIPDVLEVAHKLSQPAIAMTDHGNLHGAVEFWDEAKKIGIKAIIGCELYVTDGSRHDKRPRSQGGPETYHLTALAMNEQGYKNLCRLTTLAYQEGFYFKPRVDHELLSKYNEGIIILSGCLGGELAEAAVRLQDRNRALVTAQFYANTFKDRFYFEVQPHKIKEQQALNDSALDIAQQMGIPLVATTDCHYSNKDDHYAQEVLMCVSTGKQITDPDRIKHDGVDLHLKSGSEMLEEFGGWTHAQDAVNRTIEIAEKCNVSFNSKTFYMPVMKVEEGKTPKEVMFELARKGLERRFEIFKQVNPKFQDTHKKEYIDRLELELVLIEKMGFIGYFLVVSDFIVWAKEHGVPVGPGRGSAAGSLVAYAMRITDIDPIEHKLLFERFLNPERVSMPDIDVDFCINGRDRVIQYVTEKYGRDNVSQIATFGTLKAKAAIKDVGRALGMSFAETDKIAQLIPAARQGFDYSISEAIEMEPKLKEVAQGEAKELIGLAIKLEGLTRHSSTHAAGVVIGDRPLVEIVPLMVDKDNNVVTQYTMKYVEKVGLVKFDFLGLKTLTVIHTALKLIEESQGKVIDLELLPLTDPKVFELLSHGYTTGVFQLESGGITEMTIRLKPSVFDDLVAILALYRPGPLDSGMAEHYIERKHKREPIEYLHPLMQNSLQDTYGIILYQEQIMQLARELSGYSLGEADLLRRAMGKKNPEEMAKQRSRFISGATKSGIPEKLSNEIFDQMETFARYGFNRSHSAAYALISYHTAYLKAHYPVEFMAALMSHDMNDTDKILKNFVDCRAQKIVVLPPDVNQSLASFSVRKGCIRYGLEAVKGIGHKAVESIIAVREASGPYSDLEDFLERADLDAINRRVVENLILSGAFDFSEMPRSANYERVEALMGMAAKYQAEKDSNQLSLFGGQAGAEKLPRLTKKPMEWPTNQKLAFERGALGFYISGHPLEKFGEDLKRLGVPTISAVKERGKAGEVRLAGVVTSLKLKNTKKGDRYASFVLEDDTGTTESLMWPDTYLKIGSLLVADEPFLLKGKLDINEERCTLVVNEMESLTVARDKKAREGVLTLTDKDDFQGKIQSLITLFMRHPGQVPVYAKLKVAGDEVTVQLKNQKEMPILVAPSELLSDDVERLFGRPVLSFR
jgi:DNA polymerase-3 subunit alpha